MDKWEERYGEKYTPSSHDMNNVVSQKPSVNVEPTCIKNEEQEEHNPQPKNKPQDSNANTEMAAETYYPTTTDKAWELAEKLLTKKPPVNRKLLLTMAKKYKDTPNADFLKFYDDDGVLLIETVPSLGVGDNDANTSKSSMVQVAYFVRDLKTDEIYFPKTSQEAWTLVKKLLPRNLVRKATSRPMDYEVSGFT